MIEYINYKGYRYFLNQGITKKGAPKYFFSKDIKGKILDEIPKGYEIYENPDGLVFLRKIYPQIITDAEINVVKSCIPKGINSKVEVKKKIITIYISDGCGLYQALMRFVLVDEKTREFEIQRYCFRGSIDDWIELDTSRDLKNLANRYCIHLGKDSFYELSYFCQP